jgi:hypothetical protein
VAHVCFPIYLGGGDQEERLESAGLCEGRGDETPYQSLSQAWWLLSPQVYRRPQLGLRPTWAKTRNV